MAMGLMHIDQLVTLYKSYGSRNSPGVTGGKRSFSPKLIFLLLITWHIYGTHVY